MQPSSRKGKRPLSIVGLDVQKNTEQCAFLISCTLDSVLSRFSLVGDTIGKEEATFSLPQTKSEGYGQAWSVSIHPDPSKNIFATSGLGGKTRILSSAVENFGEEVMLIQSRGKFATCCYSPDGRILASATCEGQLALFDSETGQLLHYCTGEFFHISNGFQAYLLALCSPCWQHPHSRLLARLVSGHYRRR